MVSEVVNQWLIILIREESAFVFFGRAWLLELETSFVDGGQGAKLVDGRVYTEVLA